MFGFIWNNIIKNELAEEPTNFYYLSLIKEENDTWSIHGLWPQTTKSKYPQYCKNIAFSLENLEPIMEKLKTEWYSSRGPDDIFWKHEYLKHGTCNYNNFNEFEYFNTTLNLFDKAKLLNLAEKYYDCKTNKCLIPVNQKLDFFDI